MRRTHSRYDQDPNDQDPDDQDPNDPAPYDRGSHDPVAGWLQQRLFDQRMVLLSGYLDRDRVAGVAAQLVALDALGGHRITLRVDSPDGDLDAVLLLMDTMDTLHVPVHAFATGVVGGASLGALAAAGRRTAFRHAGFRLVEPRSAADPGGTADQVLSQARQRENMLDAVVRRLAQITLKAPETVARDLREGRYLDAFQAIEYGLVDDVAGPGGDRRRPGSGFVPDGGEDRLP